MELTACFLNVNGMGIHLFGCKKMRQVLSRAYLKSLSDTVRMVEFEKLIAPVLNDVEQAARAGRASYAFSTRQVIFSWTAEELLPLFKAKFPDCTITYAEKLIVIDWN